MQFPGIFCEVRDEARDEVCKQFVRFYLDVTGILKLVFKIIYEEEFLVSLA